MSLDQATAPVPPHEQDASLAADPAPPGHDGTPTTLPPSPRAAVGGYPSWRWNDPAIQQCLADKGVTLPARGQQNGEAASQPGSAGGGAPPSMDESVRQAVEACRAEVGTASSSPTTAATPSDTPTTTSG